MVDIVYTPLIESTSQDYPAVRPKITWQELCLTQGELVTRVASANGTSDDTTIYAVPMGKVFLLLTAQMSMHLAAGISNFGRMQIMPDTVALGVRFTVMEISDDFGSTSVSNASISPAIPLRVVYGEKINIYNIDTGGKTTGSITGYEIDSAAFYSLI